MLLLPVSPITLPGSLSPSPSKLLIRRRRRRRHTHTHRRRRRHRQALPISSTTTTRPRIISTSKKTRLHIPLSRPKSISTNTSQRSSYRGRDRPFPNLAAHQSPSQRAHTAVADTALGGVEILGESGHRFVAGFGASWVFVVVVLVLASAAAAFRARAAGW